MKLLITADPGARAHFVATWLNNDLQKPVFDVGSKIHTPFLKQHTDWDNKIAEKFAGTKIRINTSFQMLDLHLYLFLTKNVYTQIPDLDQNQFGFEITNKMIESAKDWLYHDQQIKTSYYDHVMRFSDTFDTDYMINLYRWFNGHRPAADYVRILSTCNQMNLITVPRNHSCTVAAMILEKERRLNLPEINRYWSLMEIYRTTSPDDLYETISHAIHADNYGRSDLHGVGVNERTNQLV